MNLGSGQGGTFETIPVRDTEADGQPTAPKGLMVKAASQRGLQYFEAICATRDEPAKHVMARLGEFPACRKPQGL